MILISTIYEMTHIPYPRGNTWNDRTQSTCYNCNSFSTAYTSYEYTSDILININTFKKDDRYSADRTPYLYEIRSSQYENVYHEPYKGTTSYAYFFRSGENPTKKAVDDFCYLVASNVGQTDFNFYTAYDCINQNQKNAFEADDFSFTFNIEEIYIIGYKSNITATNETLNTEKTKEPIKYLNTQGIEITKENLQANTFYIIVYEDGKREKFMIVE